MHRFLYMLRGSGCQAADWALGWAAYLGLSAGLWATVEAARWLAGW